MGSLNINVAIWSQNVAVMKIIKYKCSNIVPKCKIIFCSTHEEKGKSFGEYFLHHIKTHRIHLLVIFNYLIKENQMLCL